MHQESTRYVRLILFCHSSCLLAYFDNSCNIGGTTVLPAWPSLFQPKKYSTKRKITKSFRIIAVSSRKFRTTVYYL